MSHRKELKFYFVLFILFMVGFSTVAPVVFRWYFQHFNEKIHNKASLHIELIRDLNDIETALYVYQKSFICYLQTTNEDCLINMKEAKQKTMARFTYLEDYNKAEFSTSWVEVTDFEVDEAEQELRRVLSAHNSEQTPMKSADFQRLFYLVRSYTKTYFLESVKRLKQQLVVAEEPISPDMSVEIEQNRVDLLFLGFTELKDHYHRYFWNFSNNQNRHFRSLTDRYQIIIISGFTLTILFAILLGMRVLNLFTIEKQSKKEILALGTRDKVTGLFNFSSLKILLAQEVARAMRTERPICLLIIRIDSYDEVEKSDGVGAAERLIFQISETLKRFCRAYDRLYKYDAKTFLIVFPETPPKVLNKLAGRFHVKISNKRFLAQKGKTKISPKIQTGGACFPVNGKTMDELLKACETSMSRNFDANLIFPPDLAGKTNLFEDLRAPEQQRVAPVLETEKKHSDETDKIKETKPDTDQTPPATAENTDDADVPDVVAALYQEDEAPDIKLVHKDNEDIITVDLDRH